MKDLSVHEDCDVGWCEATPPNESLDDEGVAYTFDERQADPRAPSVRRYDHPEVVALRRRLQTENGLDHLEICAPHEIERIRKIFRRDGFAVVRDLLSPAGLDRFRDACVRQLEKILELPGHDGRSYLTETQRLPHRYSYGTSSASREMLHDPVWAECIDMATTTPILEALFGDEGYFVKGAGGDLCLPGAIEYQLLHLDYFDAYALTPERIAQAEALGIKPRYLADGAMDARSQQMVLVATPPLITINFFMSDLTWENGPIRHIPGTHAMPFKPPGPPDEPEWMRLSTMVGAPAGAGIFRDSRAWHGATPNVSRQVRAMPNVEYMAAWVSDDEYQRVMPYEVWRSLSPRARSLCEKVVAGEGEWPAGAGSMHPLTQGRVDAKRAGRKPEAP